VKSTTTRRGFFGAAAGFAGFASVAGRLGAEINNEALGFKLGVASYSFRKFSRAEAIKMLQELKTPYVSVKEFHLPYKDSAADLEKGRKEFEAAGLKIMSGGNISLKKDDDADIKKYFEYAKACGMRMIVCIPSQKSVKRVEAAVKEYNIKAAIHNHGPEEPDFPSPESVLEAIKGMDSRMGLCMDVGHTERAGSDPVAAIAKAGARLFDMHVKDLRSLTEKDSQCDVGDGKIPFPALFRALQKAKYTGCVNLEYEINADHPLPGMQRSFSYMRGVMNGIHG
jgi:sugar phosphate isomerase/epimerase